MRGRRVTVATAVLVALVAFTAGVAWAQDPTATAIALLTDGRAPDAYRIGPEDTLLISVWKNDAITKTVPVRPDGMISLPLLQDVKAAGLTPTELREELTKRLSEFIPSPEVSVILTEVRSFKVAVMGEVKSPARYDLKSWTTVVDILALAGGFNEFAKRNRIVILRPGGTTMTRIPFDYNKVISAGGEQANIYLWPGDIVLVP